MTQNPSPQTLNYSVPSAHESRWGKGFLAVCGNVVLTGLGHTMAGRIRRGICWWVICSLGGALLVVSFIVPALERLLLILFPLQVILCISAAVDAFVVGRRSSRPMFGRPVWRYLVGILLILACVPINRAVRNAVVAGIRKAGTGTYVVSSRGMIPAIVPGDRILAHRSSDLHRWDIVVFHPPGRADVFTQRIVGLPGETVEIAGGTVQINGVPVALPVGAGPYGPVAGTPSTGTQGNPIRLGPSEFYMLGDSGQAYDSRCWTTPAPGHQLGAVLRESILGRVTAVYFPPSRMQQFH